jgi:hypothetical protein
VFEDRFIEVMQFVVNHTTFDPKDELDAGLHGLGTRKNHNIVGPTAWPFAPRIL